MVDFCQGAFAPGNMMRQHTSDSEQNCLTQAPISQPKHKMHPQQTPYALVSYTNGLEQEKWVRGVFLLGHPQDSRAICFITLVPRITDSMYLS